MSQYICCSYSKQFVDSRKTWYAWMCTLMGINAIKDLLIAWIENQLFTLALSASGRLTLWCWRKTVALHPSQSQIYSEIPSAFVNFESRSERLQSPCPSSNCLLDQAWWDGTSCSGTEDELLIAVRICMTQTCSEACLLSSMRLLS